VYAETRKAFGLDHPATAHALADLASAQSRLGQLGVARENFSTVLAVLERAFQGPHESVAAALINLGVVEFQLAAYEDALSHHEAAYAMYESLAPGDHPQLPTALDNTGSIHLQMGHAQRAREYHGRALEIRKRRLGEDHPSVGGTLANLGLSLAHLGRFEEASQAFSSAVQRLGENEVELAPVLLLRAQARRLEGVDRRDDLERAIQVFADQPPSVLLPEAKFELARQLWRLDPPSAEAMAREAVELYGSMGADAPASAVKAWLGTHATADALRFMGRPEAGAP
jgi:tetratricopeptide (TPR) repeat protein